MGEGKDKMEKVCGLMKKQSKAGAVFFSGSIKGEDGNWTEEQFLLFMKKEE
jgi:hypothetical protein